MPLTSAPTYPLDSPQSRSFVATVPGRLIVGLAATVVVALAAHVSFPLPFTLVPLTLQPLAVLGVGLYFGPVGGFLTMLAYLAEGAMGLPVFSPAGPGGLAHILGPTGGYLMSYPLVAALTGGLTRMLRQRMTPFAAAAIGCSAAVVLLYLCGGGWLMMITRLSLQAAWVKGIVPFLPGELVKVLAASGIYSSLTKPRRA